MYPTCNAFVPGEWVQIADEEHLRSVLALYRNGAALLEKLLPRIGERVQIVGCSFPHGAGVLYNLSGIDLEVWQECLIDWAIREDDESGVRASNIYSARAITQTSEAFVVIEDSSGRVFAKFRRVNAANAVTEIAEVASLRSRAAFEARFHFEGDYTKKQG